MQIIESVFPQPVKKQQNKKRIFLLWHWLSNYVYFMTTAMLDVRVYGHKNQLGSYSSLGHGHHYDHDTSAMVYFSGKRPKYRSRWNLKESGHRGSHTLFINRDRETSRLIMLEIFPLRTNRRWYTNDENVRVCH